MNHYDLLVDSMRQNVDAKIQEFDLNKLNCFKLLESLEKDAALLRKYKRTKDPSVLRKVAENIEKVIDAAEDDNSKENESNLINLIEDTPKKYKKQTGRTTSARNNKKTKEPEILVEVKKERVSEDETLFQPPLPADVVVKTEAESMPPPAALPVKNKKIKTEVRQSSRAKNKPTAVVKAEVVSRDSDVVCLPRHIPTVDLVDESDSDREGGGRRTTKDSAKPKQSTRNGEVRKSKRTTRNVAAKSNYCEVNSDGEQDKPKQSKRVNKNQILEESEEEQHEKNDEEERAPELNNDEEERESEINNGEECEPELYKSLPENAEEAVSDTQINEEVEVSKTKKKKKNKSRIVNSEDESSEQAPNEIDEQVIEEVEPKKTKQKKNKNKTLRANSEDELIKPAYSQDEEFSAGEQPNESKITKQKTKKPSKNDLLSVGSEEEEVSTEKKKKPSKNDLLSVGSEEEEVRTEKKKKPSKNDLLSVGSEEEEVRTEKKKKQNKNDLLSVGSEEEEVRTEKKKKPSKNDLLSVDSEEEEVRAEKTKQKKRKQTEDDGSEADEVFSKNEVDVVKPKKPARNNKQSNAEECEEVQEEVVVKKPKTGRPKKIKKEIVEDVECDSNENRVVNVAEQVNATVVIDKQQTLLNGTVVLDKNQSPAVMNSTVVLDKRQVLNETVVLDKNESPAINSTVILEKHEVMNATVVVDKPQQVMNSTVVVDKGQSVMNATVVVDKAMNATVVVDKPQRVMNSTVEKKGAVPKSKRNSGSSVYEDAVESISSVSTEIKKKTLKKANTKEIFNLFENSPVKKRVEAFEKLGANAADVPARMTRTKTRNKAKAQDGQEPAKTCQIPVPKVTTPTMENRYMPSFATAKPVRTQYTPAAPTKTLSALKATQQEFREREQRRREKEEDAQRKKDQLLRAQMEEKKRKREEREAKARQLREVHEQEKKKLMEAQALKEDRLRQIQQEKHEKQIKLKEEAEKKRQLVKQRNAEMKQKEEEQLKKLEEGEARMRKYIEECEQREAKEKKKAPKYMTMEAPLLNTYDCYDSDVEEEVKKKNPTIPKPSWSRTETINEKLKRMEYVDSGLKNTFFYLKPQTPDLTEIFESLDPAKLRRNSSAVWKNPPRFTIMPKFSDGDHF